MKNDPKEVFGEDTVSYSVPLTMVQMTRAILEEERQQIDWDEDEVDDTATNYDVYCMLTMGQMDPQYSEQERAVHYEAVSIAALTVNSENDDDD